MELCQKRHCGNEPRPVPKVNVGVTKEEEIKGFSHDVSGGGKKTYRINQSQPYSLKNHFKEDIALGQETN
jgi:hypothetical protein